MTHRHVPTNDIKHGAMTLVLVLVCGMLVAAIGAIVESPPAFAQRVQFRDAVTCDSSVVVSMATATTTEMVALTADQRVHVCGFVLSGAGATTAKFVRGTGTNCGTGTADVTAPFELGDNTNVSYGNGVGTVFRLPISQALCVTNSAAVQISGVITYAKF
ncbi:MAG TPA: hypothetical protein VEA16_07855 [Vicinamibacterales bacterium]|nr:hypothetical protein [Vicinamibacterales bacterium]